MATQNCTVQPTVQKICSLSLENPVSSRPMRMRRWKRLPPPLLFCTPWYSTTLLLFVAPYVQYRGVKYQLFFKTVRPSLFAERILASLFDRNRHKWRCTGMANWNMVFFYHLTVHRPGAVLAAISGQMQVVAVVLQCIPPHRFYRRQIFVENT